MNRISALKSNFEKEKHTLVFCLIATFIWGIVAHAYGFLHSNYSHDALHAFYASTAEEYCKIELGRFAVPLYRYLTRGPIALPWLTGLLALLWCGLAVFFTVKIFDVKSKKAMALISGVMVTNITVTSLAATYIFELDFDMFALLSAVISVYLWKTHKSIAGLALASLMLALSIGIYQSYAAVSVALIMLCSILALFDGYNAGKVVAKGLKGIAMLAAGCALYYLLSNVVCRATGIAHIGRTNVFDFSGISDIPAFYADLFGKTYQQFGLYLFDKEVYPEAFVSVLTWAVVAIAAIITLYAFIRDRKISALGKILIAILMALLPFGMNVTYFLARGFEVHDLMIYAVWFVYVFLVVFVWWFDKYNLKLNKVIKCITFVLVGIMLWQNVILSNTMSLKKDMEEKATLSTMTRVVAQMENVDGYVPGVTPVVFIGQTYLHGESAEFERVSRITGGHHTTPVTYYETYGDYFKYVLNYPINLCSKGVMQEMSEHPEAAVLSAFPDKNSMKIIDGILVIKMS